MTVTLPEHAELHAWNTSFNWIDHTGPFRRLTDEQVRQFDERGFVVVNHFLTSSELERATAEIDEFERLTDESLREREDQRNLISESGAITFTTHLVTRSPFLRELVGNQTFTDVCFDLVGPDVRLYWDQAVYKKPEKPRRFPWHQDNGYVYVEPQAYLTCWVALVDATEQNGCPQVVPGLHRLGTLRHRWVDPLGYECFEDSPDKVAAEVKAGGAVIFSSLTPHLTGPNLTDAVRKAYIVQYVPDGAVRLQGRASQPPETREPCEAPDRQFPVLVNGARPT